jgi:hypothetical protein
MNRKLDPTKVRDASINIRLTPIEKNNLIRDSEESGYDNVSDFARRILINGYIKKLPKQKDLIDVKVFIKLLIEYRTHFRRISNYIKSEDERLYDAIFDTTAKIQKVIDRYDSQIKIK